MTFWVFSNNSGMSLGGLVSNDKTRAGLLNWAFTAVTPIHFSYFWLKVEWEIGPKVAWEESLHTSMTMTLIPPKPFLKITCPAPPKFPPLALWLEPTWPHTPLPWGSQHLRQMDSRNLDHWHQRSQIPPEQWKEPYNKRPCGPFTTWNF